ncbi:Plasmodium exported protein, unknown function [Plasmodium knowlesi strain H]|uniref:Uncharacterized protein n=3 Tax=Plasmodium knowlesi TaxID=5850 RepID=A0A5E7X171_PLAKH|nr:Plasmodium exported protein, unknown function [Plasmodium knowlesi strain H]OTN64405.1 Uncharacterized protein PKNOH_S130166800 [Plasmodium knowlesi]CAA9988841.1 Plasmodium exported protein, unknown function [Plasmodium knowlesi strain H]SBO24665.1 Plasmodium exported protein, unknown function [Plasmodium knowlesi strain H]SBO27950.1 Plasmodium exported protein, unknown function [Plasmodium knowlesi strain H]VVS78315.1 Plasmodium exported protein, unknown function [Plasmodium knowlesi strai
MLYLCVKLFLFISLICVLQNFNDGTHYNPRNGFKISRQLAFVHGHGHGHGHHTHTVHNHCTETVVEKCGSRDPTSINKYKRDPSYDFPFDRPKCRPGHMNIHAHTPVVVGPAYPPMVPGVVADPIAAAMGHPPVPYPPCAGFMGFRHRYITPMVTTFMALPYYGRGIVSFLILAVVSAIFVGIFAALGFIG